MAESKGQQENWNGAGGQTWVRYQEQIDLAVAAFGDACMERLQAQAGERILDVGCGAGTSTLRLAEQVGEAGHVLGLDFSKPLVDLAQQRREGASHMSFQLGDAGQAREERDFDALYSRFGVMFFERPALAFSNLRSALGEQGRLAFVCWQGLDKNPWIQEPLAQVIPFLPEAPAAPAPHKPGAFGLADRAYTRRELSKAGYQDIEIESFTADVILGDRGVQSAVDFTMELGPEAHLTAGLPDSSLQAIRQALTDFFAQNCQGETVTLPGSAWIVTARA